MLVRTIMVIKLCWTEIEMDFIIFIYALPYPRRKFLPLCVPGILSLEEVCTVPATISPDLSYVCPILIGLSFPLILSWKPFIGFCVYRVTWKPFIGFSVYCVSYRENRLSDFAFIVYHIVKTVYRNLRLSCIVKTVYQVLRLSC